MNDNNIIDAYAINDNERFILTYDDNQYAYEDIVGEWLGVFTLRAPNYTNRIESGYLTDELAKLYDRLWFTDDKLRNAIGKYLTLRGIPYRFVTLRGHSQGEWLDVVIYDSDLAAIFCDSGHTPTDAQLAKLDSAARDLNAWFAGDIYSLILQTKFTYENIEPPHDQIIRWGFDTDMAYNGIIETFNYNIPLILKDNGWDTHYAN